jgi:hypothetical protein
MFGEVLDVRRVATVRIIIRQNGTLKREAIE